MGPADSATSADRARPATRASRPALVAAASVTLLGVVALAAPLVVPLDLGDATVRYGLFVAAVAALLSAGYLLFFMTQRMAALDQIRSAVETWSPQTRNIELLQITASNDALTEQWNTFIAQWRDAQQRARDAAATNRLQAERATPAGDARVFDLLPQGLLLVNADGKIGSANGAACRMLAKDRGELVASPFDQSFAGEEVRELVSTVLTREHARGGTTESTIANENGVESIIRGTVRPLGTGKTRQGLVVLEDVTQQRTADQSRNLFVAQATHELRTPLTNIGLYVERAIELAEDAVAERSECLNVINGEVLRLGRVVEEVLSVSEIEAGSLDIRRDDVRVDELVRRLEDEYRAQAQAKSIALTVELPPKLSVVQGDREKIAVALHNLLGNAVKYTPAGKTVRVEVEEDEAAIEVRVSDTGIGISPEDLERVFDKFYRAPDKRIADITGTGLGLSLAREVIRLHGGDVTAESTLNEGSTFTLRLPIKAPSAQRKAAEAEAA